MLTDEKRKKLLAGMLIAVMLTGVAGCGSNKDSEWKNDNSWLFPLVLYRPHLWCRPCSRRAHCACC